MSRKNIGVFVAGDEGQLKIDFINGVSQRASQLDCNVIVFDSLIHKPEFDSGISLSDEFIRGETSIYMGHDLSDLDAVVMMGDTLINKDVKNQIIEKLTARIRSGLHKGMIRSLSSARRLDVLIKAKVATEPRLINTVDGVGPTG